MKTKYLVISMMFILSVALMGCGSASKASLESYMNDNPKAKTDIEKTISGMNDEEMTTDIEFEKNTIIITETLNTEYSDKIVKKMEEAFKEMPESSFTESIEQVENLSGIEGIKIKLVLKNGNGEPILEREYS